MDDPLQPRNCFGGAIDLSLPSRFIDVSDFRPIPDNQEVFTDADLDQSLIIEIVVRFKSIQWAIMLAVICRFQFSLFVITTHTTGTPRHPRC